MVRVKPGTTTLKHWWYLLKVKMSILDGLAILLQNFNTNEYICVTQNTYKIIISALLRQKVKAT